MQAIETSIRIANDATQKEFEEKLNSWIQRAKGLNFKGIILDITGYDGDPEKTNIIKQARKENQDFDIYTRCTCTFNERKSIKENLNNIRKRLKVDFIAIKSNNQEVLNFLAKDSRIDIIRIENLEQLESFTIGVASLASQSDIYIELPVEPLISTRGTARSKNIRAFKKIIEICENKRAKILLASDATSLFELKNPWQKAITLGLLLDLNRQIMRTIIFKNPSELASNLSKFSRFSINEVVD